jgi:light-harvesting complex 1 beta chain
VTSAANSLRGISPDKATEDKPMMGLPPDQAKEFHEQFKITYTAFVGIAAVAHLLVLAWKPWF